MARPPTDGETTSERLIVLRSLAIWLFLICAEIVHGILRAILLVPMVGKFRSNQIGVFMGSTIICEGKGSEIMRYLSAIEPKIVKCLRMVRSDLTDSSLTRFSQ